MRRALIDKKYKKYIYARAPLQQKTTTHPTNPLEPWMHRHAHNIPGAIKVFMVTSSSFSLLPLRLFASLFVLPSICFFFTYFHVAKKPYLLPNWGRHILDNKDYVISHRYFPLFDSVFSAGDIALLCCQDNTTLVSHNYFFALKQHDFQ